MAEAATPEPASAVKEMIEAAGLRRIICVDDAFAADVDSFVAILAALEPAERADVLQAPEEEMAVDGLWQERARARWRSGEPGERAALADDAYARQTDLAPVEASSTQVLAELAPDVEREALTLTQWNERKNAVIAEMVEIPTLILFDQDFTHEEDGSENTGQKLIQELESALETQEPKVRDAYYGLLTNTVLIENEHARRQEIVQSGDVNPARFVLISKENFQDLERFAARLRTTLLSPIFVQLMNEVTRALDEIRGEAIERASAIAPEDMEYMVVRTSGKEGVWPADTLLRVLEVMQRTDVRKALRIEPRVVTLTDRLRRLADQEELPPPPPKATEKATGDGEDVTDAGVTMREKAAVEPQANWTPVSVKIAHDEIYETAEHVNGLHLPVELGDMVKRGDDKRFIVVAQPCDLMVRRKGVRAPNLTHFLLAEVSAGEPGDAKLFASFELPYFYTDSTTSAFVRLGRLDVVRAHVIDACVLNADGRAIIDLDSTEPAELLPHWRDRRKVLHKIARGVLTRRGKISLDLAPETEHALCGHMSGDPFPVVRLDPAAKVVEWDCQRIGRVCEPYARALLSRFSQYFARDAYLQDLAKR